MISRFSRTAIMAVCTAVIPFTIFANSIEGIVYNNQEQPIAGALLTLSSNDGLYTETVYSDKKGNFRLITKENDSTQLRARKLNFADFNTSVDFTDDNHVNIKIKLRRLKTPFEIADNLTASAHYTRVKFDDPVDAGFFRIECLTCHQLGNSYTRMPRSKDRWTQIVDRMLGFYGVKDEARSERYANILFDAFDGSALEIEQKQLIDPMIFTARIRQWKLPQAVIAHDVEYHSVDGKFYTVDQAKDQIHITDPNSNLTESFSIPDGGIPIGGKFLSVYNNPNPLSLAVSRGPHSLQEGPDGKFYITDTVSGQIGVFDPQTRKYIGYDIGGRAMYPHTLRFDANGRVWFTLAFSNQVGRFDPQTGDMIRIDLPETSDRPAFPVFMPYGIDVNPVDGSIWYSRLMANRIGRINPDSLVVEEYKPPLIGPRRMRFAIDGALWIPSYGDGNLVKLDTKTMEYKKYPIPTLSPQEMETPYALAVHPRTQEVWITANMSDRVFRFLPDEERFITYPLPTRGIFLRDMIFTPDGSVCSASSMPAARLAVEGGMEEVICIDPDYQTASTNNN